MASGAFGVPAVSAPPESCRASARTHRSHRHPARRRLPSTPRSPTLKAAPADQGRLLDLQELDARLDQLSHRRHTLPAQAEVARLSARDRELRDELVVADTECSDLDREQRKAEADVEQVRARARRDRERMDSGRVAAKELQSLQHELESLARRQSELEDIELDVMERLETAQQHRAEVSAAQSAVAAELADMTAQRDAALAEIDGEATGVRAERETVAATVPADLSRLYEKLRAQNGGVGAAALRHRRCGGCRLELNPQDLGRMAAAPTDEVLRCEECGRILVRVADSGL